VEDLKSKIFYLNIFIYYFRRTSRRAAGSDSNGRRLDYDISPVRGGGSEDISVKGNRDRRYRRTSPQRRRGHSRSR